MKTTRTLAPSLAAVLSLGLAAGCADHGKPATSTRPPAPAAQAARTPPLPRIRPAPAPAPLNAAPPYMAAAKGDQPAPAPAGMPVAPEDPVKGVFTLEQATAGLPGPGKGNDLYATIDVAQGGKPLGTFTCQLYPDKAPATVANFVGLARGVRPWKNPHTGIWVKKPFYDGLTFHRVIPNFMIQGGDPVGTGAGDGGFTLPDEWDNGLLFDKPGLMAMANRGHLFTGGTQFFITETRYDSLDPRDRMGAEIGYTIFGACQPVSLVERIARVPVDDPGHNMPLTKVVMTKVTISRTPPKTKT